MQKLLIAHLQSEKLGIDNIKEAFSTILELSGEVRALFKNWNLGSAFSLLMKLAKYQILIPAFKEAIKEAKDLDKTEISALQSFFKDKIDLENENLEKVIEEGIDIIVEGYDLVERVIRFYIKVKSYIPKLKDVSGDDKKLTARVAA